MVFTDFKNSLAKLVFLGQKETTMPMNYYVGFSTTVPQGDGSNITEPPRGSGYSKQKLTLGEPIEGVCSNTNLIEYGEATQGWGKVVYTIIYDEKGNALFGDPISSSITVIPGDIVRIKIGNIKLYFGDAVVWA